METLIFIFVVLGSVVGGLASFCVGMYVLHKLAADRKANKEQAIENKKNRIKALNSSTLRGNLVRTYKREPIQNEYHLDMSREIGKGGWGVVIAGTCKSTQVQHAIKIVTKKTADINRLERELKLLKNVDHTNIVRLFSAYDSPSKVYFVMELCQGGHLGNLLSRQNPVRGHKVLPEAWARRLCRQLLSAVAHLHDRGIAHRDIKLQNVLLDIQGNDQEAQIKLIDFGFGSCFIGALPMRTKCGTLYTTAPEVIREHYDQRCDVWSVGVVIFTLLCGKRPFEVLQVSGPLQEAGKAAMITNILAGRYHTKHRTWNSVSKLGLAFVKELLCPDYTQRMHSSEALEHPWLNDNASVHMAQSVMKSSKSYRALSNMQKNRPDALKIAGATALVFGLQPTAATDLRGVFQAMDRDGSGSLSLEEFTQALKVLTPELSLEDGEKIFNIADLDKNNQLSYTEFLIAAVDPREVDIEELGNAFHLIDLDRNGHISRAEIFEVVRLQYKNSHSYSSDVLSDRQAGDTSEHDSSKSVGTGSPKPKRKPSMSPKRSFLSRSPSSRSGSIVIGSNESEKSMGLGSDAVSQDLVLSQKSAASGFSSATGSTRHELEIELMVDKIFDEYDLDKDGSISYAEFLFAMTGLDFYLHESSYKTKTSADTGSDDEDDDAEQTGFMALSRKGSIICPGSYGNDYVAGPLIPVTKSSLSTSVDESDADTYEYDGHNTINSLIKPQLNSAVGRQRWKVYPSVGNNNENDTIDSGEGGEGDGKSNEGEGDVQREDNVVINVNMGMDTEQRCDDDSLQMELSNLSTKSPIPTLTRGMLCYFTCIVISSFTIIYISIYLSISIPFMFPFSPASSSSSSRKFEESSRTRWDLAVQE